MATAVDITPEMEALLKAGGASLPYSSMKAAIPDIAAILGCRQDWLYERQRELIRKGLMPTPKGRGPGNGLPVRGDYLFMLLAGALIRECLCDLRDAEPDEIDALAHRVASAFVLRKSVSSEEYRNGVFVVRSFNAHQITSLFQLLSAHRAAESARC